MLTENISKPQNQALMKQIDQWENESINKIRQAAEEARQILIKHSAGLNMKLEEKLEILTNKLRQSRQENDFFEKNLNQWKEELVQMKSDLTKRSNITIRDDSTPLVTKIVVGISGKTFNIRFKRNIMDVLLYKS
jgi:CRISPR/Cas system CMR subunit Cmr4 (Cas7 group RAMP superfamily)